MRIDGTAYVLQPSFLKKSENNKKIYSRFTIRLLIIGLLNGFIDQLNGRINNSGPREKDNSHRRLYGHEQL